MAKNKGWGSSTDGNRHSTGGSFRVGKRKKKGACSRQALLVGGVVIAHVVLFWGLLFS